MLIFLLLMAVFLQFGCIFGNKPCVSKFYNHGSNVCVCNATYCDTIDDEQRLQTGQYLLFVSSKEGLRFNRTIGEFSTKITSNLEYKDAMFRINATKSYQELHGFGGSFTDAACINILSLSKETQDNLLRSYFSKTGIKYSTGRVPIGGTDFSTRPYTYDDGEPDIELERFNLTSEDINLKIPIITRAKAMSDRTILLVGSAWSAPISMKSNNAITGFGFLRGIYYRTWADYHIRFLDEYKKYNISFWALTTGNEPINGIIPIARFNSMGWTPWGHREWIGQYLGPKLQQSQHNNILIIGLDDQRFLLPWWMKWVFQDEKAAKYINGIGVHWYIDFLTPISLLDKTHEDFPDKFLMYTEACSGTKPWARGVQMGSWERGEEYMHSIISTINHWVTAWTDWNIALNEEGGPNWTKNHVDSPIIVNSSADEFYKQPQYYALAHVSKFINPGASRIDIQPQEVKNIETLAIQNPDNGIVIVLHNMEDKAHDVIVEDVNMDGCFKLQLPRKSFATLVYWP